MSLKFGEGLGSEWRHSWSTSKVDLISAWLGLHNMSFIMPLSQYFPFVHYHVGAADGPAYSSQSAHLAWSYWGCCCLFPHFKGMECRCGYIASFSCSAFLKEKFVFVSVKMMGVLFAPVGMGVWSPNSFSTRKLLSLAFYNLKWNSIYVLNGSVLVRLNQSLHGLFSLSVVDVA